MKQFVRLASAGVTLAVLAACGGGGSAPPEDPYAQPVSAGARGVSSASADDGAAKRVLDDRLKRATGTQKVWVTLGEPSVAAFRAAQLAAEGLDMQARAFGVDRARALSATEQAQMTALSTHRSAVRASQDRMMSQLSGMGARELGRVHVAHNAVAVEVPAASLAAIAQLSGVAKVRPVIDYQLDLSQTVPYVGGTALQSAGRTGAGVRVAVLDSGIDYTHRNLGGAGTLAAYAAAYGANPADAKNKTLDGLFPTAKVIGGYDFVGEDWPNSPEAPDPDPIDFEGHGTHVADIIAGRSTDGAHKGMAPDAKLLAVKVCSAVATSCSGVALLQGMDFALDPNGDGDTRDAVDVINMSLGSNYGQVEDDLTLAAVNAVKLGVTVVASAGNGSNKPYVTGSPSMGVGILSVAQTEVPSAVAIPLVVNSPASIANVYRNTQTVEWAPVGAGVTGDVVFFGRGCPAGSVAGQAGADPVVTNPSGKIALIDRGACSVSLKVDAAAKAGATGVLIGLVAGGDAVSFSYGGGTDFKPTLVIQQALSNAIKARLAAGDTVNVSMSPAAAIPLVGSMAATSSRGPSYSFQHIKPEIGAPGASLSAEVGTGNGQTPFGGTSGAAPMVAGAAALLIEAHPKFSPERIKALLMNSAETTIYTNPALIPGELAPITRIGAGELRVDRAAALTSLAWNPAQKSSALSFGALEVDRMITTFDQTLRVENHGHSTKSFAITPSFRYGDDAASGAVTIVVQPVVVVPAGGYKDVNVRLRIDPDKLPSWTLDGGFSGGNGAALNKPEYDGYLTLTAGAEKLSVPWHVLPRRAANTQSQWISRRGGSLALWLNNTGHETGDFDVFSLTGTSAKAPRSEQPQPGDNVALVDLRAVGVRYIAPGVFGAGDYLEFAISTHGRRAHPAYPAEFDVYIDTNNDGVDDYVVYNLENGGFGATGQTVVAVANLATGSAGLVTYLDADLNSSNAILTVPMASIGLAPGQTIRFSVYAFDNYFSGFLTDALENMLFTPASPRFVPAVQFGGVPSKTGGRLDVARSEVDSGKSSETGLLLMHRRAANQEAEILPAR